MSGNQQVMAHTKKIYAWAMYDWANSAYSLIIMAGFFPVLFKSYWADGMSVNESSFWLGTGNTIAAIFIALISPALGALADRAQAKKRMLLLFTSLGVAMTAGFYFIARGDWQLGLVIYILSFIAYSGITPFYNALIFHVCSAREFARVSSLGYALGYLGGGLLLAFTAWMIMQPEWFGFAHKEDATLASFVLVALWWAVFSVPIFIFVDERKGANISGIKQQRSQWHELRRQFNHIRSVRTLWLFLLAYWFYIGAVGTVSRMGVDYGLSLGFSSGVMITALLASQIVAFPAALLFGRLAERYRELPCILVCIFIYIVVCFALYRVQTATEFYLIAGLIGAVLGGAQALSRSMYAGMIPKEESAGLFGFYNLISRASVIPGPLLMGLVSLGSGQSRLSIFAVVALLLIGGVLLFLVRDKRL